MRYQNDLTGKIFGFLTAVCQAPPTAGNRGLKWVCRCECGGEAVVRNDRLVSGKTRSCGCLQRALARLPPAERTAVGKLGKQLQAKINEENPRLRTFYVPKVGADMYHALPHGTYQRLLDEQQGVCAVCQRTPEVAGKLHLDHDHATEQVRGLLCSGCNTGLGLFREDPAALRRAAEYLALVRVPLLRGVRKLT